VRIFDTYSLLNDVIGVPGGGGEGVDARCLRLEGDGVKVFPSLLPRWQGRGRRGVMFGVDVVMNHSMAIMLGSCGVLVNSLVFLRVESHYVKTPPTFFKKKSQKGHE